MAQDGEIDLKEVKAKYSLKDIRLVDSRELDFANEFRITYEVSFAIGMTLFGNIISSFNWIYFGTMIIFLGFGIFHYIRYLKKQNEMKNKDMTSSISQS